MIPKGKGPLIWGHLLHVGSLMFHVQTGRACSCRLWIQAQLQLPLERVETLVIDALCASKTVLLSCLCHLQAV